MWQITIMDWVFKTFKYLKEKFTKTKPEEIECTTLIMSGPDSTDTEPKKDEPYPGFDATGKMIFDDEPKANKKYWVDRDLEATKHLMRMQKMVAKSITNDQILFNKLKAEIQKLYLLCEPDVDTLPMQMNFMALNAMRDEQRAVKKRLANNASTAYWLKQQLK